ncbi:MAG: CBS domain-containing protein [Frankiaceae bacterium]|nr:CBS domain-containing protein [Frankiaceae bacterium]
MTASGTTSGPAGSATPDRLGGLVAADVMTGPVVSVDTSALVADAIRLMRTHGVRHLPVVENGRFLGLVDDRLVAHALLTASGHGAPEDQAVSAATMHYVPQAAPTTPMPRVANLLRHSRTDAVVVVDDSGRLLGIVTTVDVVSAVAHTG